MWHFSSGNDRKSCKSRVQDVIRVRQLLPFGGMKAPKTLVLLCFGAIRERRMIRDRSLLTSWTLGSFVVSDFISIYYFLNFFFPKWRLPLPSCNFGPSWLLLTTNIAVSSQSGLVSVDTFPSPLPSSFTSCIEICKWSVLISMDGELRLRSAMPFQCVKLALQFLFPCFSSKMQLQEKIPSRILRLFSDYSSMI